MNPFMYYADENNMGDRTLEGLGESNKKKLRKIVEAIYGPQAASQFADSDVARLAERYNQRIEDTKQSVVDAVNRTPTGPLNSYAGRKAEMNPLGYGGDNVDMSYQAHLDRMENRDKMTNMTVGQLNALGSVLPEDTKRDLENQYQRAMSGSLRPANPYNAFPTGTGNSPSSAYADPSQVPAGSRGWAIGADGNAHMIEAPGLKPGAEGMARVDARKAQRAINEKLRSTPGFSGMTPSEKAALGYVNQGDGNLNAKIAMSDPAKQAAYRESLQAKKTGRGARRRALAEEKLKSVNPYLDDMGRAAVIARMYNIPIEKAMDYIGAINQQKIQSEGQIGAAGLNADGRQKPSMTTPEKLAGISAFEGMTPNQKRLAAGTDPEMERLYKDWAGKNQHLVGVDDTTWEKIKDEAGKAVDPSKAYVHLGGGFGSSPRVTTFDANTKAVVSGLDSGTSIFVPAAGKKMTKEELLSQWDEIPKAAEKKKAEDEKRWEEQRKKDATKSKRVNPYGTLGDPNISGGYMM